jgi:hypothetical protein
MAEKHEVIEAIEALATHCRPPLMGVEERVAWVMDWCHDLRDFPIENVRMACQRWRQGDDRKFPMPGQLLPLVRATMRREESGGRPEPWRPVSDGEYQGMTVREKIRHHQIMLAEAGNRGGPMFRQNGAGGKAEHLTADQMPPKWHDAQAEKAFHNAEIKRLRGFMQELPAARRNG